MARIIEDYIVKSNLPNEVLITKTDKINKIVFGVVYEPEDIDTDGETISKEHVAKMAWNFISSGLYDKIDINHSFKESGSKVVESFVARKGDLDFPEDAWVLGVQTSDAAWEQILAGELNGFSLAGPSSKSPKKVIVEIEKQIVGNTEKSTVPIIPEHEHNYVINYDINGNIVSGKTDTVMAHFHDIKYGTATEKSLDHNHRFIG